MNQLDKLIIVHRVFGFVAGFAVSAYLFTGIKAMLLIGILWVILDAIFSPWKLKGEGRRE